MAGVYVHVPFCRSKCAYCDFYSVPQVAKIDLAVSALGDEWRLRKAELGDDPVETLYIGGGTPSVLDAGQFECLANNLPRPSGEFTVEVNPDDVTGEMCQTWLACGLNRVSMGVQSFNDAELAAVGRRHDSATALRAVQLLEDAGFERGISLDLIYGLPGQTLRSWQRSVDMLLNLHLGHFSAYCLSYEPGTRLHTQLKLGRVTATDDDTICAMYDYLCAKASEHGYEHYEISNFALPGKRAQHNSAYWKSQPYLGLGPSAHSFDGRVRRINPTNMIKWHTRIADGHVAYEVDEETDVERLNDIIMVRLRTCEGLDLSALQDAERSALLERTKNVPREYFVIDGGWLRIPESRWMIADAVIRELMA